MASNAYIASDREKLMKVGKANDLRKREKQIDLPINITVACLDESAAFRVEDELRQFVVQLGGIKHAKTLDWFVFDPQIYHMLCEFATTLDGFKPLPVEEAIDAEIRVIRRRYQQLIEGERKTVAEDRDLQRENERLQLEIISLQTRLNYEKEQRQHERQEYKEELKQKQQEIYDLHYEVGYKIGQNQVLEEELQKVKTKLKAIKG